MRRVLLPVLAVLLTASVVEARPSTLTMSCGQAAATVAKAGAIVLTTGAHTYDRFVAHNGFCIPGQDVEAARAPTSDDPNCQVGYTCKDRDSSSNNR